MPHRKKKFQSAPGLLMDKVSKNLLEEANNVGTETEG